MSAGLDTKPSTIPCITNKNNKNSKNSNYYKINKIKNSNYCNKKAYDSVPFFSQQDEVFTSGQPLRRVNGGVSPLVWWSSSWCGNKMRQLLGRHTALKREKMGQHPSFFLQTTSVVFLHM